MQTEKEIETRKKTLLLNEWNKGRKYSICYMISLYTLLFSVSMYCHFSIIENFIEQNNLFIYIFELVILSVISAISFHFVFYLFIRLFVGIDLYSIYLLLTSDE